MKLVQLTLAVLIVFSTASFSPEYYCRRSGIKGQVYMEWGNRMPAPDMPLPSAKPMQTTLYIYELTNITEVQREGVSAFYKHISTAPVKQVQTDSKGRFKVKMKPGLYSLFVKKGDLYYSSQFDEKNNIHPVEVKQGKMAEVSFKANYDAVY